MDDAALHRKHTEEQTQCAAEFHDAARDRSSLAARSSRRALPLHPSPRCLREACAPDQGAASCGTVHGSSHTRSMASANASSSATPVAPSYSVRSSASMYCARNTCEAGVERVVHDHHSALEFDPPLELQPVP